MSLEVDIESEDYMYWSSFLSKESADFYFYYFKENLEWEERTITLFGKTMLQPRLLQYYGDAGTDYVYSKDLYTPKSWDRHLFQLKASIEQTSGYLFNSALANYYRNGQDSMGWHRDDEPELGNDPIVASLTLGYPRTFSFKQKGEQANKLELAHGSLLIMLPSFQLKYKHSLPKRRQAGPRINLTFRRVITS